MFFQTTDERIGRLEKRMSSFEKDMKKTLLDMNESLKTITEVISRLQEENKGLKDEGRMGREKESVENAKKSVETTAKNIAPNIISMETVKPIREMIEENYEFVQKIARDGLSPSAGDLCALVGKEKEISMKDAASRMKVHELQVEKWAGTLKAEKLITITDKSNRKYLCINKQRIEE